MARYRVGLETRARILTAARELLGEVGPDAITVKSITDRAGVGTGSFYNLFDSKDAVVLEVVREALEAVDPDPAHLGGESVAELVGAFVRFVTEDAVVARIYLWIAVAGGLTDDRMAARVLRSHQARLDRFAAAIRRESDGGGAPAPDRDRAVHEARDRGERLLAALTGLAIRWMLEPDFDLRHHADRLREEVTGRTPVGP